MPPRFSFRCAVFDIHVEKGLSHWHKSEKEEAPVGDSSLFFDIVLRNAAYLDV